MGAPLAAAAGVDADRDGKVRQIIMANSIAVTSKGQVLFTQTSSRFSLKDLMLEFMSARGNGRLLSLSHYSKPGRATSVAEGLVFPNGLALHASESYVLVASSQRASILKISLPDLTQSVLADNLPCIPDNLAFSPDARSTAAGDAPGARASGADVATSVWVGCAAKRARPFALLDTLGSLPSLRRIMGSALYALDKVQWVYFLSPRAGLALRVALVQDGGAGGMYVCMHACMYACMHTCMHACMHVHAHAHTFQ